MPVSSRPPGALLGGVCVTLARATDLPPIAMRLIAVVLSLKLFWLTFAAYIAAWIALRAGWQPSSRVAAAPAPVPGLADTAARFAVLERRMAGLESAVLSDEVRLRRRFRDIGA